jgi:O-antigen/teichoic acid export membrane protein
VSLLTVIAAQRQNAALAVAALAVLAISNIVLAPLYGVLGAAIAVAMATFLWLVALRRCARAREWAQDRRPIPARKVPFASLGVGLAGSAAGKLDGAVLFKLLLGLLGCEQRGPKKPEDKGRNGQKGDGGANFAEM